MNKEKVAICPHCKSTCIQYEVTVTGYCEVQVMDDGSLDKGRLEIYDEPSIEGDRIFCTDCGDYIEGQPLIAMETEDHRLVTETGEPICDEDGSPLSA